MEILLVPLVVGFQSLVHLIVSFLDCHRCSVSYFLFTPENENVQNRSPEKSNAVGKAV